MDSLLLEDYMSTIIASFCVVSISCNNSEFNWVLSSSQIQCNIKDWQVLNLQKKPFMVNCVDSNIAQLTVIYIRAITCSFISRQEWWLLPHCHNLKLGVFLTHNSELMSLITDTHRYFTFWGDTVLHTLWLYFFHMILK